MFIGSALFHFVAFALRATAQQPVNHANLPAYYVDLVTLPVSSPRASGSAEFVKTSRITNLLLPRKISVASPQAKQKTVQRSVKEDLPNALAKPLHKLPVHSIESNNDVEYKISRMRKSSDARELAKAIANLHKTAGVRGNDGREAGEDYIQYLRSRLRDAFRRTIALQTKRPEVIVSAAVSASGHLEVRTTRSTGDKLFESAVERAIDIVNSGISVPPPKQGIVLTLAFKPESIQ